MGRWAPVLAWASIILISTSLPGEAVPAGPAGIDKVGHFFVYAVLGVLATRAASAGWSSPRKVILAILAVSAFAALDEWHQGFIPGRVPDASDWVADVAGATIGAGSVALFTLRRSART